MTPARPRLPDKFADIDDRNLRALYVIADMLDMGARSDPPSVCVPEEVFDTLSALREVAAAARDVACRDRETYVPPVLLAKLDGAVDRLRRTIGDVELSKLGDPTR